MGKKGRGGSVNEIDSGKNTITPIDQWNLRLKMESTSNINNVLMFALDDRVLLGTVNT